jgi:predicted SprT family Zn-dependent metalloprotease
MDTEEARELARTILDDYGLEAWAVEFDRAKRRFGQCRYMSATISLSAHLVRLNDAETVADTIRHEVAHALAGSGAGHGPKWRAMCRVTGANPQRCYDSAEVVNPDAPWALVCPQCAASTPRFRRTRSRFLCRHCRVEVQWVAA